MPARDSPSGSASSPDEIVPHRAGEVTTDRAAKPGMLTLRGGKVPTLARLAVAALRPTGFSSLAWKPRDGRPIDRAPTTSPTSRFRCCSFREPGTGWPIGSRASFHVVEDPDHEFRVPRRSGRTDDVVLDEIAGAVAAWCRHPI